MLYATLYNQDVATVQRSGKAARSNCRFNADANLARLLWTVEPNASGVSLAYPAYVPQPNESFNADANIGHRFAILMANVSALRASRSGAG
jgi:hypothetical protein